MSDVIHQLFSWVTNAWVKIISDFFYQWPKGITHSKPYIISFLSSYFEHMTITNTKNDQSFHYCYQ